MTDSREGADMTRMRLALTRPAFLRWLGLGGAVLLAISAYLFGAWPTQRAHKGVGPPPLGVAIIVLWLIGTAAMTAAWWYGRHLAGRGALSVRWVLVTAFLWMLPFVFAPPIGSRDVYAYSCQGALFGSGLSPYTHGVSALPCPWLNSVSHIWQDTPSPYGPFFLLLAAGAAKLGSLWAAIVAFRVLALLGVGIIAVALPVLARRVGVPESCALWVVLACPLVPIHVIGGAHNDGLLLGLLLAGLAVLASHAHRPGALVVGGVLVGLAISMKITLGVVLPFAALFAAGAPALPALGVAARRIGIVFASALGTLLAFSFGTGLRFGWIGALSHAGDYVGWTSPPTAVGLAINYVTRLFGLHGVDAVPACRLLALVALPIALLVILWHSRNHNPLYGAGLALLAVIFLAPITQPWYLTWPLAMLAVTNASARWLAGTVVVSMALVIPDGSGFVRVTQLPMSFAMTALVVWVAVRAWSWMRGFEPKEIDFDALRRETEPAVTAGSAGGSA